MRWIEQWQKVLAKVWPEDFAAAIDPLAEDWLGLVDLPTHVGMLRTLPRKEEINGCGVAGGETGLYTFTVALREHLNRIRDIADDGRTAVREFAASDLQGPCNIGHA